MIERGEHHKSGMEDLANLVGAAHRIEMGGHGNETEEVHMIEKEEVHTNLMVLRTHTSRCANLH
jgi:hypothetical protein